MNTAIIDRAGVTISTLCIVHCVLLPFMMSLFPVVGVLAENEAVHKTLVFLAVLPAVFAFSSSIPSRFSVFVRGLALFGVVTLFASAFAESLHDFETSLTVVGAFSLASAHILRGVLDKPLKHVN